eukprot:882442-Pelagomonas_calceolata.AAC.3
MPCQGNHTPAAPPSQAPHAQSAPPAGALVGQLDTVHTPAPHGVHHRTPNLELLLQVVLLVQSNVAEQCSAKGTTCNDAK